MTWQRRALDGTRRAASPLEVDLIDALAHGAISRRDFLRRGAILGVSGSVLASVVAACTTSVEVGQLGTGGEAPTSGAEPTSPPRPTLPPRPTAAPAPTPEPTRPARQPIIPRGGSATAGVISGSQFSGLDPINMLDLGTYGVVSQSFEYLVGLADDGFVGPTGLASSWSPNADGTAWTFNLRPNVSWHDGTRLTARDVVATVDRMVVAGIAGLSGVVSEGAATRVDDLTVTINLDRANGNFPVLMSIFNAQSLITPADYRDGTTLDERPAGTGPWRLVDHDIGSFTTVFEANEEYWGGRPSLDEITLVGFESNEQRVAAFESGSIDVIQSFTAIDGSGLLNDEDVTVLAPTSTNHRQVWFNTQLPTGGPLTDVRVRQAIAYCVDRQQVVDEVYQGRGVIANDHAIHPSLPFFDAGATPQRVQDIALARQLLSDAELDGVEVSIEVGDVVYSEALALVLQENCAAAGIRLNVGVTNNADFYASHWCPGASWGDDPASSRSSIPCGSSAEIGIVDWGHRAVPDIFLDRGLTTDADWNSANFASSAFDDSFADYSTAIDVAGQQRAVGDMQRILRDETPVLIPAFFDYLAGHRASLQGVQTTALGHIKLERAQWVES